jgi:hypothetical protein
MVAGQPSRSMAAGACWKKGGIARGKRRRRGVGDPADRPQGVTAHGRTSRREEFRRSPRPWAPFIKNWTSYDTSVTAWLTAISLGIGLVFDGIEGPWTFQTQGHQGFGGMRNWRFAAARAMPPPLKSIRGSARPEMGYPNTEEQMRHSSDESNQVRRERKLWKRQDCTFCPFRY